MKSVVLLRFSLIIYTIMEIILSLFLASKIVSFLTSHNLGDYSGTNGVNFLHFKIILFTSLFILLIKSVIGFRFKFQTLSSIIYTSIITYIFIFPIYFPSNLLYYFFIWFLEVILFSLTNFIFIEFIRRL